MIAILSLQVAAVLALLLIAIAWSLGLGLSFADNIHGKQPFHTATSTSFHAPAQSQSTLLEVSTEPEYGNGSWHEQKLFGMEKRAVFSKLWLYAGHRSRFVKAGDYHVLELAGFPIFLIQGKDDKVRAFFDICAHRAYRVTKRDEGSSMILGCRYHGWSYSSVGALVKAPHFDTVLGFEKAKNGLFEIQTWMDDTGMIFVNLDKEQLDGSNNTARYSSDLAWVSSFDVEGNFNWKSVVSEYGRLPGHDLDITVPITFCSRVIGMTMSRGFPMGRLYSVPGSPLFYSISMRPLSGSSTSIHVELYNTRTTTTNKEHAWFKKLEKSVSAASKTLEDAQALTKGLVISQSNGADTQVAALLAQHVKSERRLGREVHPAARERNPGLGSNKAADCETEPLVLHDSR